MRHAATLLIALALAAGCDGSSNWGGDADTRGNDAARSDATTNDAARPADGARPDATGPDSGDAPTPPPPDGARPDATSLPDGARPDVLATLTPSQIVCGAYVAAASTALCGFVTACCSATESSELQMAVSLVGAFCGPGSATAVADCATAFDQSVSRGRLTIDPAGASDCAAALRAVSLPAPTCGRLASLGDRFNLVTPSRVTACQTALHGSQPDGGACVSPYECQSRICDVPAGTSEGHCLARVAAGGACTSSLQCDDPNRCIGGVCAARVAAGGACTADGDCADNLFCDRVADAGAGTCAARLATGASCQRAAQCASGRCNGAMCLAYCVGS